MPKLDQNANKTLAEAPTLGNLHPDARAQAIARGSREDALIAALRTHDGDAPDGWQFGLGLVKFDDHGQFADFRWATQSDIDAAIERATPQAQPAYQYYYYHGNCTALSIHSPSCICWHDEGTGSLPEARAGKDPTMTWRVKEKP